MDKVDFKENIYFFVSFSQQGDEVIIKRSENTLFDLRSYKERILPGLLASTVLKKEPLVSKRSIGEAVGEYLIEYGYSRTYNLMMNLDSKAEDPWLAKKEEIRKQLIANNFDLALLAIRSTRKYVRNRNNALRTIYLLQMAYLIRKGETLKKVFDFMSKHLAKFKGDKIEMMNREGFVIEVDLKVRILYSRKSSAT